MPKNPPATIRTVLSIAGFDPSSGAGVTADLQVFAAHGLFGTACITALTVQSTLGVEAVEPVAHLIAPTLEHLDADLPPAGIKIGMLGSAQAVLAVAAYLRKLRGRKIPIVLDPVFVSSSGRMLLHPEAIAVMRSDLLPLVDWITPNRDELTCLGNVAAILDGDVEDALRALHPAHPHLHMVATGGDCIGPHTVDLMLTPAGQLQRFEGDRFETSSTHGTGCAFSSALLSRLVLGDAPTEAVAAAKTYVAEALRTAPGIGGGSGPINLLWPLSLREDT